MANILSDETEKILEENRILREQMDLLCGRIWELEHRNRHLNEPVIVVNKTCRHVLISQIDVEYMAVGLTELRPGEQRLVKIGSRRWEIS